MAKSETALIVGAGLGLSASLARKFSSEGVEVALAARNIEKLDKLIIETSAKAYICDATDPSNVEELFRNVTEILVIRLFHTKHKQLSNKNDKNIKIPLAKKILSLVSEFHLEKLLEKRDSFLNILKHLSFELLMEPTEEEIKKINELEKNTLHELDLVQKEISDILSKNDNSVQ